MKFNKGFVLYLVFVISWFTHLTGRIPALGAVRFDLLLVVVLFILSFVSNLQCQDESSNAIGKFLKIIIIYSIVTLPFVEWPGSVLSQGVPRFIKAIVFYYFTVKFIRNEKQLKIFMAVFLSCQTFRILEPLYLHVTQGYWGSMASMANWEYMNRLSGAPNDIVNPNGLAFVIVTVTPFFYYYAWINKKMMLLFLGSLPLFVWALVLTASRSGFVAIVAIVFLIAGKSSHKVAFLAVIFLSVCLAFPLLSPNQKDRYLSIVSHDTKNAATAEGRLAGLEANLRVAMRRPLFGHGLGTSLEANANFGHNAQPAHDLYAEVLQELGLVGLFIFLGYIFAVLKELLAAIRRTRNRQCEMSQFMRSSWDALQVFFFMNLLFSLASFGLSGYEWYLIPGLISVLSKLQTTSCVEEEGNAAKG